MYDIPDIMFSLDEALFNLKKGYPGKYKAFKSFSRLMNYLKCEPIKAVIIIDENTGFIRLEKEGVNK